MQLREAREDDCKTIYEWRIDPISQEMFINNRYISFSDHYEWFHNSLKNNSRCLYIGEIERERIGISRFDFLSKTNEVEVSINLNPKFRGKGFAKDFLLSAIDLFEIEKECVMYARIKVENIPSKKLFENAGFKLLKKKENLLIYKRSKSNISFREVNEDDEDLLFDLLGNRIYSISHKSMPSFENHREFVKSNPYLYWYLVFNNKQVIGTFYIKDDNSIGMNILNPSLIIIKKILYYINHNFTVSPEIPSKVPPYFFINVADSNKELYEILDKLGYKPIQTSFKI